MIKVSAPGKLVLAGEWAVLEVRNPAIVASVNKRVFVEIEGVKEGIYITIQDFGIKGLKADFDKNELKFERRRDKKDTRFMKAAIETVLLYLGNSKPFKIRSWDETHVEINGELKKVGLGSSAASVVATIGCLLRFNHQDINSIGAKEKIYKLAAIAHYFAQGKELIPPRKGRRGIGSGVDVAASTYGGIFVYQRFDPEWLVKKIESGTSIKEIVEQDWPFLKVKSLKMLQDFNLLVAWTSDAAGTSKLLELEREWTERNEKNKEEHKKLFEQISTLVRELIKAWRNENEERIMKLVRKNEVYLRELGEKSGVNIESPNLRILCKTADKCGAAGKLSGAGGGDCGIAFCFNKEIEEKVKEEWKKTGFLKPLEVNIDFSGVREEDSISGNAKKNSLK